MNRSPTPLSQASMLADEIKNYRLGLFPSGRLMLSEETDLIVKALRDFASSETKERKPNIEAFMASVVPPPGYVMEQYDLTKNEEVIRMAKEIGGEWAEGLMPLVKSMEMEQRVLFFSALWATPLGHCCASIGEEGTQAVLDTMKLLAHGIGQRNEKKGPPQ